MGGGVGAAGRPSGRGEGDLRSGVGWGGASVLALTHVSDHQASSPAPLWGGTVINFFLFRSGVRFQKHISKDYFAKEMFLKESRVRPSLGKWQQQSELRGDPMTGVSWGGGDPRGPRGPE